MRRVLRAGKLISVMLCLASGGCIPIVRGPDHCVITWNAVTADKTANQAPGFTSVRINVEKLDSALTLRMPDGQQLRTDAFTPEVVWPYTFFGKIGGKFPTNNVKAQVHYEVLFDCTFWTSGGGYSFEFQNGRLVALDAAGDSANRPESCRPGIGNADATVMYAMPLTEEQLTNLFGPFIRKDYVRQPGVIP
jgi:hypothetical protein